MYELKRLCKTDDNIVQITSPLTNEELINRHINYPVLSPMSFAKREISFWYRPVELIYMGKPYSIQVNRCVNPFCLWFGQSQERFNSIKSKPYRYKLQKGDSNNSGNRKQIMCNPDPLNDPNGIVLGCGTEVFSNWSVAEEIRRLATINSVTYTDPTYNFHKDGCDEVSKNPFDNKEYFYKRGTSTAKSMKWQCKSCKKITNVLPDNKENFGYHQKKNDIIPLFIDQLLNRTPVKRACAILDISPKTYYNKLEWVYRKCLEFLQRHETQAFAEKKFDSIWINSDKMVYYLNNIRQKGKGGIRYDATEDNKFQTSIVISSDMASHYVFRADVAYDYDITLEQIEKDTLLYKDDHLYGFSQKNARLRTSYCPQPPTSLDTQTMSEYLLERENFEKRKDFIDGSHVNASYTSIAHYFLLKTLINSNSWNFVSDNDSSIIKAVMSTFANEVKARTANYFLCRIDKTLSIRDSYSKYMQSVRNLKKWARDNNIKGKSLFAIGLMKLTADLNDHDFYEYNFSNGNRYPVHVSNPIKHPLPSIDEGVRFIDCITNLSGKSPEEMAKLLINVSSRSTNAFLQQIRRRISILERPLVTARGDGKSYIYSNYNPKYAQYATTILRTFYNFCWTNKKGKVLMTPAQRIGIADKKYNYKDIIYFV